ncbi:MAG: two-component system response regulator CreB [Proteobacteria bacterium]|nr:MAG: two-component system response regulator CreB [Pseudomonadota bacterium]
MKFRVLLVEDEEAIAHTLIYALETEGFETEWTRLGSEAMRNLLDAVHFIILDIGLPDINGFDLCRQIRQQSDTPILFLTARQSEIDKILGLELGGDDYVTKPFSPREVVARVKRILKRSAFTLHDSRLSTLEVNVDHGTVVFHGVALKLTRYELLLLNILRGQPGRIFSRAVLMDAVWTDALDTDERTVDTHIKTLRAKLRAVKADPDVIQTHRGLGYSLQLES